MECSIEGWLTLPWPSVFYLSQITGILHQRGLAKPISGTNTVWKYPLSLLLDPASSCKSMVVVWSSKMQTNPPHMVPSVLEFAWIPQDLESSHSDPSLLWILGLLLHTFSLTCAPLLVIYPSAGTITIRRGQADAAVVTVFPPFVDASHCSYTVQLQQNGYSVIPFCETLDC